MIKISIIIPVYNVEKYLRQCLDSVINQTYKNLEIICVDDCSNDNSRQILKEYVQKDDRIKLIFNETNMKVGATRNKALNYVTGEYVHFLDSDDYMKLDAYEKLAKIILSEHPDVIQFQYQTFSNIDNSIIMQDSAPDFLNNNLTNVGKEPKVMYSWLPYSCNKIYSLTFLRNNNIFFPNYPCFEDSYFSLQVLLNASSIYLINDILYNYRKFNEKSLTNNFVQYVDFKYKVFIKSAEYINQYANEDIKQNILLKEFADYYEVLFSLYRKKRMSYQQIKIYFTKIDYNIFDKKYLNKGYLSNANDIINFPEILFCVKYKLKCFLKNNILPLYKLILKLKEKFNG